MVNVFESLLALENALISERVRGLGLGIGWLRKLWSSAQTESVFDCFKLLFDWDLLLRIFFLWNKLGGVFLRCGKCSNLESQSVYALEDWENKLFNSA